MEKQVGSFSVEDAFHITGRGWVLAGILEGQVSIGNCLLFHADLSLPITGVEMIRKAGRFDLVGLLISTPFASRQEIVDQNIIGATARIVE